MSRNTSFQDGTVARVVLAPFKFALASSLALAGLLLVAWTVSWLLVDQVAGGRVAGMRELLRLEMASGSALVEKQGFFVESITAFGNGLYALVFEASGLHAMGQRFAHGAALSIPDTVLRRTWLARQEEIEVAMLGTQLVGLRAGILARFLPLIALLYLVGAVDGLARRAIRRTQAARESASLYHRAKYAQVMVVTLGTSALLIWPRPVNWAACILVGSVLLGVLAAAQWAFYKKHF
jgi:hypothetical protein